MKKLTFKVLMMAVFTFVAASFAQAQVADMYRADIPFDFSMGSKQYAAGVYFVEVRGTGRKYFVLRDSRGRQPYAVSTRLTDGKIATAALDFQRIGSGYFMTSIRTRGLDSSVPVRHIDDNLAQNIERSTVRINLSPGR